MALDLQLTDLATLYGTSFALEMLSTKDSAILLGLAATVGWVGSWLSVSRHLWQIEPH